MQTYKHKNRGIISNTEGKVRNVAHGSVFSFSLFRLLIVFPKLCIKSPGFLSERLGQEQLSSDLSQKMLSPQQEIRR